MDAGNPTAAWHFPKHLCDLVSGKETRLLVVGGAGSLYVNPEHTAQVMDGAGFPEAFKPLAYNMGKALDELRARTDVKWTYISPAGDFQADGAKTGKYILGGEELTLNARGESVISYADYAVAMVDEALNGNTFNRGFPLWQSKRPRGKNRAREDAMTQTERLTFLINYLLNENGELKSVDIPAQGTERERLLRSLMSIARPKQHQKNF